MPIDASIPMTGRALRLDNPLDSYSKYNAILGAQSQNRLADLVMSQKQGEMAAAAAEDRAYSAAGDPRDPNYRANLEAAMVNEGRGRNVPGMRTAFAAQDEAGLKVEKARVDTALSQYGLISQLLSGATPENYQAVLGEVAKINPGSAKNLPPVYEKAQLDAAMAQGIPRLEQMKQRKEELDAAEAARNAQLNRDVTIRGQDLAASGRAEANAIAAKRVSSKGPANLSATAQKELFEADDTVQSSKAVIGMLDKAITLNDKAYSGYASAERAKLRSNLPGESDAANATVDLNNIITGQALESLKATFGAMPTEGERKILLEMQASVDKTPKQRAAIIERAKAAAERRLKFNKEKAKRLRDGSYMTEGAPEADDGDIFSQADAILGGM